MRQGKTKASILLWYMIRKLELKVRMFSEEDISFADVDVFLMTEETVHLGTVNVAGHRN